MFLLLNVQILHLVQDCSLPPLIMWSAKYDKDSAVDMKFVRSAKRDKVGLISEISLRLADELSTL
jgi:hypothetical protein